MLRALLRTLFRRPPVIPLEPLLDAADLDPALPASVASALRTALTAPDARALSAIAHAGAADPTSPWPWVLQSRLHDRQGDTTRAAGCLREAATRDRAQPLERSAAQHLYTRGRVHLREQRVAEARRCLALSHALLPKAPEPLDMLGFAGYFDGEVEAGRADYDRAIERASPQARGALRVNRLIDTLPQVFDSQAHVEAAREAYSRELDALLADPPVLDDPLEQVHRTVFYLCYQGGNDRVLNEKLARLFLRACPSLAGIAPHVARGGRRRDGRLRIGIVSMFLTGHSVGAWYRELVRQVLESGRFACTLFTYDGGIDPSLREAAVRHGHHVNLAPRLDEARRQVAEAELDLLAYTDVGMHPFLYFLAFARLAPAQALLVGHPCTSGIPALDWFVSNVHQDGEQAQAHYSERLVRLPVIPVRVPETPHPAQVRSRAECGFAEGTRVYLCPMMLQKLHPAFDAAIAGILRADPAGEFVLFRDRLRPGWEARLAQRFARAMPEVADRIVFRPFAPAEEFHSLLLQADCVVDPFLFSGGVTTYTALSLGVPVVTLPGELFRSRMTAGIYAQAGVPDCIARSPAEFVSLATALAANPARRREIGERLRAARARFLDTAAGADALMDWMERTITAGPTPAAPQGT